MIASTSAGDQDWTLEAAGPAELGRKGWTRNTLKAGDQVTVDGYRAKSEPTTAAARTMNCPAGKPCRQPMIKMVGRRRREAVRPIHSWPGAARPAVSPLHDPGGTAIYVSGTTGRVVTWTTASHRFWSWLGTIPHFLYSESLGMQQQLWSQAVIWTSLLGTFLTAVGLILGVAQFGRGSRSKISPYRGWFYWRHVTGLVFGVLTLTWVFSGEPLGFS